jgi:thiosulfate dehydrogenase
MRPWRFIFFGLVLATVVVAIVFVGRQYFPRSESNEIITSKITMGWVAPDTTTIPHTAEGDLIRYGRKLIANTAQYLGPKGSVISISNSMNCQNCHMDAGAKLYGNSFSGVASIYPVFRPRSGIVESIEFRINDCFKRSMNGKPLDTASTEMHAMTAFLKWVGKDVPKKTRPKGTGVVELAYLDRPADPVAGKLVYDNKCRVCHGKNGDGISKPSGGGFIYPPLWGSESYNNGAGLFRLTRFAGFVKFSMPFGATFEKPQLTDEEAWDVAAFVNSQPRPEKFFPEDWPDLRKKAVDYPYGPFADNFSEGQHKYGPFGPIKAFQDSLNTKGKKPKKR